MRGCFICIAYAARLVSKIQGNVPRGATSIFTKATDLSGSHRTFSFTGNTLSRTWRQTPRDIFQTSSLESVLKENFPDIFPIDESHESRAGGARKRHTLTCARRNNSRREEYFPRAVFYTKNTISSTMIH